MAISVVNVGTIVPTPSGIISTKYRDGDDGTIGAPTTPALGDPVAASPTTVDLALSGPATGGDTPYTDVIEYSLDGVGSWIQIDSGVGLFDPDNVATVTVPDDDTTYYFRYKVIGEDLLESQYSAVVSVTTPATVADTTAPSAASSLSTGDITANTWTLTWSAATDNVGVTGYDILLGLGDGAGNPVPDSSSVIATGVAALTYVVQGLDAEQEYYVRVRARDAAGNVGVYTSRLFDTTEAEDVTVVPLFLWQHDTEATGATVDIANTWKTKIDGGGNVPTADSKVEINAADGTFGSKYLKTTLVKNGAVAYRAERQHDVNYFGSMSSIGNYDFGQGLGAEDHWERTNLMWYVIELAIQVPDAVEGHYIQWHDNPGGDSRSPPLSLFGSNLGLRIRHEKNYDRPGGIGDVTSGILTTGVDLSVVHRYMFKIKWTTLWNAQATTLGRTRGSVLFYMDNDTDPRYSWEGQTCHPGASTDGRTPYVKTGIYKTNYRFNQGTNGATNTQRMDNYAVLDGSLSLAQVKAYMDSL